MSVLLNSISGNARASCYSDNVALTLNRRSDPQIAVSTGNSTSVGRPAEYNTYGEYAGRVAPVLTRVQPTRLAGRGGRAWGNILRSILCDGRALAVIKLRYQAFTPDSFIALVRNFNLLGSWRLGDEE